MARTRGGGGFTRGGYNSDVFDDFVTPSGRLRPNRNMNNVGGGVRGGRSGGGTRGGRD